MGIVDLVTVRQVAQLLREIYDDGCRRCAEDLQQFTGPLNDWVDELLQRQLPDNWREQLRQYLAEQEPKGYRIEPENLAPLEDWIHDWAEYRGLLPTTGGEAIARTESDATDQPFVMAFAPNASGPPAPGGAPVAPAATFANGFEVAGPGPEVTASFKAKVQQALEVLDPRVGNWWQANSVRGLVRARAFWLKSYESRMEANEQPVVIVDQNYTAGQTAQAIIAEVSGGWFADSIGAFYKKYKFARTGDYQEFLAWQQGAVGEAAKLASMLAEFYINGIATLTPAGDLIVTLGDVTERGPRWDQLISVLPYVSYLPIGAIVFKLGAREIKLPKPILKQLDKISSKERKVLLARANAAKTDDEAAAIITAGLGPEHHIATNKNWVSSLRGGPWSPAFEKLFKKAGMTLEDVANKVRIPGHEGPHPEAYHREIYRRLSDAVADLSGEAYARGLLQELERLAAEIRTPGTELNRLLTR